jgi:hypothetical protein
LRSVRQFALAFKESHNNLVSEQVPASHSWICGHFCTRSIIS